VVTFNVQPDVTKTIVTTAAKAKLDVLSKDMVYFLQPWQKLG
jgi:hypothetical protein